MATSKHRLETFIDGVIAIIITIMVLSIPLPKSFELKELLGFASSLFIYLLSFLVVGAFWNQHHQAFSYLEKLNQKIIAANIFFLFFLSLIPLFTKWVIENQGSLIPVIGYDLVYLAVSFFYAFSFQLIMEESNDDEIKHLNERMKSRKEAERHASWLPLIVLLLITAAVVFGSIYFPKVSIFMLMAIPISSSIFNLLISRERKVVGRNKKNDIPPKTNTPT